MAEEQQNTQNPAPAQPAAQPAAQAPAENTQNQAPAQPAAQPAAEQPAQAAPAQPAAASAEQPAPAPEAQPQAAPVAEGPAVQNGSKVKLDYRGLLDDGSVFDTSEGRMPLEFEVGAGQVIPGFDNGVIGLKVGEEKDIVCQPAEAYGEYNEQLIQVVPREMFKNAEEQLKAQGKEIEVGIVFGMQSPQGHIMHAKVVEIKDDSVKVDLNHQLAGKVLTFKVKIVEIN